MSAAIGFGSRPGSTGRFVDDRLSSGARAWLDVHALSMLVAISATALTGQPAAMVIVGGLSFALYLALSQPYLAALRPFGGYANHLTAIRLLIVLCAGFFMTRMDSAWLLAAFVANVLLDAADGFVARRSGQVSSFGALFDRETDALFVAVAYAYFFCTDRAGAWVLIPGVLPYVYHVGVRFAAVGRDSQVKEKHAALLAGTNYVVLLVAIVASGSIQQLLISTSVAVVYLSFSISLIRLLRRAR